MNDTEIVAAQAAGIVAAQIGHVENLPVEQADRIVVAVLSYVSSERVEIATSPLREALLAPLAAGEGET